MRPLLLAPTTAAVLALLAVAGPAQAENGYVGYYFGGATAESQWRNIWGHLLANSYRGERGDGGVVTWSGQGSHSSSGAIPHWVDSPVSASFRSDEAHNFAGTTHSGGSFTLPAANAYPGVTRARYHLYSVLDDNPAGDAAHTSAYVNGNFYHDSSTGPYAPVYWRIDWSMATSGDAVFVAQASLPGPIGTLDLTPGQGSFSGVFDAGYYPYPGTQLNTWFMLSTTARDFGSYPGTGRVDLWATLSFSNAPIAAVPEPGTWAMWLGGLGLLGVALRRRRLG